MNKIIITLLDKKEISLFDSKEKKTIWKKELNRKILGTYKVGKYLFIYTYSNWGYSYTSLLHFESGDYFWMDKLLSLSLIHI